MRPIPAAAAAFIKREETCMLRVYDDAHPARILTAASNVEGTLTGGYGHTGIDVHLGMVVTQQMADDWLDADLATAGARLERKVGADIVADLSSNQYAALISFTFNLGVDGKMANATIWKRLRARQYDQVPIEMAKFVNAGGQKELGLVRRRAAEQVLWSTGEPGINETELSSAQTRDMSTAATPADPVPASKSAGIWGSAVAAVSLAVGTAKDAVSSGYHMVVAVLDPDSLNHGIAAISPFADKSPIVGDALQMLALVAAGVALVSILNKHKEARA